MFAATALIALAASAIAAPAPATYYKGDTRYTSWSQFVSNPDGKCAGPLENLANSGMSLEFTECDTSKKQLFDQVGDTLKLQDTPYCLENNNGIIILGNCESANSQWVAGYLPGTFVSKSDRNLCLERTPSSQLSAAPCSPGITTPKQTFHFQDGGSAVA